jgi:hypothetical protein
LVKNFPMYLLEVVVIVKKLLKNTTL